MVPPCSWTTQREIASPRPVPLLWAALVVNRSNTALRSAAAIPGPSSATSRLDAVASSFGGERDHPTGGAVPGSVVQQVRQQLVQAVGIRGNGQVLRV